MSESTPPGPPLGYNNPFSWRTPGGLDEAKERYQKAFQEAKQQDPRLSTVAELGSLGITKVDTEEGKSGLAYRVSVPEGTSDEVLAALEECSPGMPVVFQKGGEQPKAYNPAEQPE